MAFTVNQTTLCSWKKILGIIAVIQILLVAAFQGSFFAFSSHPLIKVKAKVIRDSFEPVVTKLQQSSWTFSGTVGVKTQTELDIRQRANSSNHAHALDLHLEHPDLGHTFDVSGHSKAIATIIPNSVAIGLAITSIKCKWSNEIEIRTSFPFFHALLPSFCETASHDVSYNFFLAFDKDDKFFTDLANLRVFQSIFYALVDKLCHPYAEYTLHFVQCSHNKHPAWAQNDAMIAAYMANMQYYYRINDDTLMKTKAWTDIFIKSLNGFTPPNVGVVGPTHKGGNTAILTYDFVHYTHIEIHGFYYPHSFPSWHADRWITDTYKPGRCLKVKNIILKHTLEKGQRYHQKSFSKKVVQSVVSASKSIVENYVARLQKNVGIKEDSQRVISLSLYGRDPLYTYGAIRNLQLHKLYMPEWTIRVYVLRAAPPVHEHLLVPQPVIDKLFLLGARIVYLNETFASIDPKLWRFLVADDKSVEYFLIRDTESRLDEKFELLAKEWLTVDTPFFCVRDFDKPEENVKPIIAGLIGARRNIFLSALGNSMERKFNIKQSKTGLSEVDSSTLNQTGSLNETNYTQTHSHESLINDVLWPIYESNAKCFDSYLKSKWKNSQPFPTDIAKRSNYTLGSSFNQFEMVIKS